METFPNKNLLAMNERPWFADMANFKVVGMTQREYP